MAKKIHCNDEVIVLTGKDKGKIGKIKKIFATGKAIVEGINIVKKHQKPIKSKNQSGGCVKKEASIDISNLAILNPATNKADRVGFKIENSKKIRIFKSNGQRIK